MTEVTDAMIRALASELSEHFELGGYAPVRDYLQPVMTAEEHKRGLTRLKAADAKAQAELHEVLRHALEVALAARQDELSPSSNMTVGGSKEWED